MKEFLDLFKQEVFVTDVDNTDFEGVYRDRMGNDHKVYGWFTMRPDDDHTGQVYDVNVFKEGDLKLDERVADMFAEELIDSIDWYEVYHDHERTRAEAMYDAWKEGDYR